MMNTTKEKKTTAPSPSETTALFAAIKSATREEHLVLYGVLRGLASQRSITERAV